ncbi:MAG: sensor histidine kinase [Candidatus Ventricola sp.]
MIFDFESPALAALFSLGFGLMETGLLCVFLQPLLRTERSRFGGRRARQLGALIACVLALSACSLTQRRMNMLGNVLLHECVVTAAVAVLLRIRPVKSLYLALVFHLCMDIAKTAVLDMLPHLHDIKNSLNPADKVIQVLLVGLIALVLALGLRGMVCRVRLRKLTAQQTAAVFLPALPYIYVKFAQYRSFAIDNTDITQEGGMLNFVMCILALMMVVLNERTLDAMLEREEAARERLSLEYQRMQMQEHKQKIDEMNRMAHDMRNHLATIAAMSDNRDVQAYVARLQPAFKPIAVLGITGCEALDVLLSRKMDECSGIHASLIPCIAEEALHGLRQLSTPDICTIYGNLLDNAIEAVGALEDGAAREIVLRTGCQGGLLLIRTENRFAGERRRSAEDGFLTTKEDADAHGYGLRNVQETARRLGGDMTVSVQESLFIVNVLLPVALDGDCQPDT